MSEDRQIERHVRTPDTSGTAGSKPDQVVEEIFTGAIRSGPAHHPIFDKFEPQHVTQFLKSSFEEEKFEQQIRSNEQQIRSSNRWFRLVYVGLAIGIFVFLTLLLMPDQSNLYFQLLQGLGLFGSGFAGGYGFKSYQDQRSE